MARGDYSFILSSRWLRYIALAVLAACACGLLANWQNHRREERDAQIATIETHYEGSPVPLNQALATRDDTLRADQEWTKVSGHGRYDTAHTVLARNRSLGGQVGFYVVVPFDLERGGQIAVVRGWVPVPSDSPQPELDSLPQPPQGQTTVTMWLRPAQDGAKDDNPPGSIKAIDPARIPGMDEPYAHVYGEMAAEEPAGQDGLQPLPKPNTDPGSHLSYTMQWIAFGIMILVAVLIGARRERSARAEDRARADARESAEADEGFVLVDKDALASGARLGDESRYGGGAETAYRPRRGIKRPHWEDEEDEGLDDQGV
ncbi:SURF1 family protein [Brevibacterium sp. BRM-1]|uniref:SURF1 family cytochrome oxidase biogenesis protein n=1 Tax=Brevibacterium sp. BRM-1 TaxID=2999062 RepID=UPI002280A42A|nr:SURF1 family protein [Brevibacterium sp. BRM-1]WAL40825.1 SURF1 family protein [Brevibacterium sp. BRM-1]